MDSDGEKYDADGDGLSKYGVCLYIDCYDVFWLAKCFSVLYSNIVVMCSIHIQATKK